MQELIKISQNEKNEQVVSARELHQFLESKQEFANWIKNRIEKYDFVENQDFVVFDNFIKNPNGGRPLTEYAITLDMAKELAMVEGNEKGKQVRRYFIECEKKLKENSLRLPQTYADALRELAAKIEEAEKLKIENTVQKQQITELKPKADYCDEILKSKGAMTVTQIAKDYGMSGQKLNVILHDLRVQFKQSGQWLLYEKYHSIGYTKTETTHFDRLNGDKGFSVLTKWTQKGRLFLYNLLKQNGYLPLMEQ